MIRLVVFDLWKTLASRSHGYCTRRVAEEFGIDVPIEKMVRVFEYSVQTRKWKSKQRAYENFCRKIGIGTDRKDVGTMTEIADVADESMKEFPHTIGMLKGIRKGGYKTGLLSNSSVFAANVLKKETRI